MCGDWDPSLWSSAIEEEIDFLVAWLIPT